MPWSDDFHPPIPSPASTATAIPTPLENHLAPPRSQRTHSLSSRFSRARIGDGIPTPSTHPSPRHLNFDENKEDEEAQAAGQAMREAIAVEARLRSRMLDQFRKEEAARDAGPSKAMQEAAFLMPDGDPWQLHELAWKFFEEADIAASSSPLQYDDVPWPPRDADVVHELAKALGDTSKARRTALRLLQLRWHPDKFDTRYAVRANEAEGMKMRDRARRILGVVMAAAV